MKRFWLWATRAENYPYLRLMYEAQIVAIQNPSVYGRYLKRSSADWQAISLQAMSETAPHAAAKFFYSMVQVFMERLRRSTLQVAEATRWGLEATGLDVEAR